MAIDAAVGTTEWKRGRRPTAWRVLSSTRHRRRDTGGVKAMLYRFASARNLSDQYLRVYSERASALHDAQIRHSQRRRRIVEVLRSRLAGDERVVPDSVIASTIGTKPGLVRRRDMSSTVTEPVI